MVVVKLTFHLEKNIFGNIFTMKTTIKLWGYIYFILFLLNIKYTAQPKINK